MANPQNLKRPTAKEAREKGAKGGIASGEARRKKKLMSQIYADFLIEKFKIDDEETGKTLNLTGDSLVNRVIKKVMMSGGSGAVSLMKEIREATEGSKTQMTIEAYEMTPEERRARLKELIRKTDDGK